MTVFKRSKKIKTAHSLLHFQTAPHPLGIKPLGNTLFDNQIAIRSPGLGIFGILTDEILLDLLYTLNDAALCALAQVSKAMYCFVYTDDLWKDRLKKDGQLLPEFIHNWRCTYIHSLTNQIPNQKLLKVQGMFSDHLFTSWRCASVPLQDLCGSRDTIPRISSMTEEQFLTKYSKAPFILTDIVSAWPAMSKWTMDYFVQKYGSQVLKAEAFDVTFKNYASYASQCQEESPLYLFDKGFANGTDLEKDYKVPEIFKDFFDLLGKDRPDYRWLIIGPRRSGSTFHIDPNGTSAWNAVIKGSKKWILYPPSYPPPGVFPSPDGSEVTSPVSLVEWYLHYYHTLDKGPVAPIECICKEGELVFIPSGWWHSVMNLEDSIAITQNFVSEHNLGSVLDFLKDRKCQVSGVEEGEGLFERFLDVLETAKPDLVCAWRRDQEGKIIKSTRMDSVAKQSLWSTTVSSGFSFDF